MERSITVDDELRERGFIEATSDDGGVRALLGGSAMLYQGFDPTSDSLHAGHLQSLLVQARLQRAGHTVIFLLGGATALVGDPTGREEGRRQMTPEEIAHNAAAIRAQVQRSGLVLFDAGSVLNPALMLNNADWLDMGLFEYLRGVTVHFSVNQMVKTRTFAARLESGKHLSLFEFLYPTLQAFDFLYLFDRYGCRIQLGGADQWSNILDGVELIRRVRGGEAYALTMPLLITGAGEKMGKTAAGETIWLDPAKTPPFAFYQYWLNTPDVDIERGFLRFTFLSRGEIAEVMGGHPRAAQHRLAFEVTRIVHGEAAARQAREDAVRAFGGLGLPNAVPTLHVSARRLQTPLAIGDLLVEGGAVPSRTAARRLIEQGAVRMNERRVEGAGQTLTLADCHEIDGQRAVVLRYGKGKVLRVLVADEHPPAHA